MGRLTSLAGRVERLFSRQRETRAVAELSQRPVPKHIQAMLESRLADYGISLPQLQFDELAAYCNYVWIYAPAFRIAVCMAQVPFRVYQGDPYGDHDEVEPDHPARRILSNPNDWQSRFDLWEDTGLFLELKGEAPWAVEPFGETASYTNPGPPPEQIAVLRPDCLTVKAGENSRILRYEYRPKVGTKAITYRPEEIVFIKWRNPKDDYRGLGSVRPSQSAALLDRDAIKYNTASLKNDGEPGGMITVEDGSVVLQQEQIDEVIDRWMAAHAGADNARRPMVQHGGMKWQSTSRSPREMEYQALRKVNREEMLAAFGVPPVLVGWMETSIRANAEIQKRSFWEDTMMPKLLKIEESLNSPVSGFFWRYGADVWGKFDLSQVSALQENADAKAARYWSGFDRGAISPNDIRVDIFGKEPLPGGDFVYLPMGLVQAGPTGAPQRSIDAPAATTRQLDLVSHEARRTAVWRVLDQRWLAHEAHWRGEMRKFFAATEERVLQRLRDAGTPNISADYLYPKDEEGELLGEASNPLYQRTVTSGGKWGASLVKEAVKEVEARGARARGLTRQAEEIDFDELAPETVAYIKGLEQNLVQQVTPERWERVRQVILQNERDGGDVLALMDALKPQLQSWRSDYEVSRIARTEVIKASNGGAQLAYKQSGVVNKKEWLTAREGDVRETHAAVEREQPIVGINEKWSVGSSLLDYPGDPAGAGEEVINCRCTHVPVIEEV